jgi:hypothetical protein
MGEVINANLLAGKLDGKRSLGRPRHRWEKSITNEFKEIRCEDVD